MNISVANYEELYAEFSGETSFEKDGKPSKLVKKSGSQPTLGRRRGKSPQQFNGIHRRRTKKIRW